MSVYLELRRGKDIVRDRHGYPYSWKDGPLIRVFYSCDDFEAFVEKHVRLLKDAVVFTGSASEMRYGNQFVKDKLKDAGLL